MIKCEELLKLDIFKNFELVAGKKGLHRMITWPYPIHTEQIEEWVRGGELLIISRYHLAIDNRALRELVEKAIKHNLSGIIVEGGMSIVSIDEDTLHLADAYDFPLFWTAVPVRFIDITKAVSNMIIQSETLIGKSSAFLERLFGAGLDTERSIYEWAEICEVDLQRFHTIAVFSMADTGDDLMTTRTLLASIQRTVISLLNEKKIDPVSYISGHSIAFLLTDTESHALEKTLSYLEKALGYVESFYEQKTLYLSFGRIYENPLHIKKSFEEALRAMKLLKNETFDKHIVRYCDIGSYQLLFEISNPEEVLKFRDLMLKNIYDYDEKNGTDLLYTLRKYIENDRSISKTAEELIIHRNTLLYRLNKVKKLTKADLNSYRVWQDFLNAFIVVNLYPF